MTIPRQDWAAALSALPTQEVLRAAEVFAADCEVSDLILPQAGLALLTLRDGAFHEPFHLGEVPVSRAQVLLRAADGRSARGGAVLLDDRARFVRALAILDGALSGRLPGWEAAAALVERGAAGRDRMFAERRHMLASTRVDFTLLGQASEDDDA
jgi:alpha-D-ribose 1-methylphosphonate 5-triphosphate synthase subunit PhnG